MIDTENKRHSTLAVLPVPDSAIGVADRMQALWLYSGISAVGVVTGPFAIAASQSFTAGSESAQGIA